MVLKLEKTITKNNELRSRYPDQPLKFVESEADLDEEIKNLTQLSSVPELYPELIKLHAVDSIVSLIQHENTDISIAAIELLNELTDEDVVAQTTEEGELGMKAFVSELVSPIFEFLSCRFRCRVP